MAYMEAPMMERLGYIGMGQEPWSRGPPCSERPPRFWVNQGSLILTNNHILRVLGLWMQLCRGGFSAWIHLALPC